MAPNLPQFTAYTPKVTQQPLDQHITRTVRDSAQTRRRSSDRKGRKHVLAAWYWAVVLGAALGMQAKEAPQVAAEVAVAGHSLIALLGVDMQLLDLVAALALTVGVVAHCSMLQ